MPDHGCACHWTVNDPPATHDQCEALWAQIAAMHYRQGSSGYTFYNWGYCNHGLRLRGRGWDRQSGANGTTAANRGWWAVVWLGGPGHVPSPAAFKVLQELVDEAPGRKAARPHSDFYPTACPGPEIRAWTRGYVFGGSQGDDVTEADFVRIIAIIHEYLVGAPVSRKPDGSPLSLYDRIKYDLDHLSTSGGLSETQIRRIVRDELNKTRLAG